MSSVEKQDYENFMASYPNYTNVPQVTTHIDFSNASETVSNYQDRGKNKIAKIKLQVKDFLVDLL